MARTVCFLVQYMFWKKQDKDVSMMFPATLKKRKQGTDQVLLGRRLPIHDLWDWHIQIRWIILQVGPLPVLNGVITLKRVF